MDNILQKGPLPYNGLDFTFLRAEGIQFFQQLVGEQEIWTDFNTHDPGITLLEGLIYAITGVGLPIAIEDENLFGYLNNIQGVIPNLASSIITENDKRKMLIDYRNLEGASLFSNVWFSNASTNPTLFISEKQISLNTGLPIDLKGLNQLIFQLFRTDLDNNVLSLENSFQFNGRKFTIWIDYVFPYIDELPKDITRTTVFEVKNTELIIDSKPNSFFAVLKSQYRNGDNTTDYTFGMSINVLLPSGFPFDSNQLQQLLNQQLLDKSIFIDFITTRAAFYNSEFPAFINYLHEQRLLCEDYGTIEGLRRQEIAIQAIIDIERSSNIENLLVEIFYRLSQFLSPVFNFQNSSNDLSEEISLHDANTDKDDLPYLDANGLIYSCLLYTSPSPRDRTRSRMPSSA